MGSLDYYNEAASSGILSDNSAAKLETLQKECDRYQNKIDTLNGKIEESKRKIGSWRTEKTTADTERKKILASYISAEQAKITSDRADISALKNKISDCKSRMKTVTGYKPASYYINKGADETTDYYKNLLSVEKSSYGIWYEKNKDSAGIPELVKAGKDSLGRQAEIQQDLVDELWAAYQKNVELYGADDTLSRELEEAIKGEEHSLEKIKNSTVDIDDMLSEKEKHYKELVEDEKRNYDIWFARNKDSAGIAEIIKKQSDSIIGRAKIQKGYVGELAELYHRISSAYGEDDPVAERLGEELKKAQDKYAEMSVPYADVDGIISERKSRYKNQLTSERNDYELWYRENRDTAGMGEQIKAEEENLVSQTEIQRNFLNELASAYDQAVEIYGEDSPLSKKIAEEIKIQEDVFDQLKSTSVDVKKIISNRKSQYEKLLDSEEDEYDIWYEQNKNIADGFDVAEVYNESVKAREEIQKDFVDELLTAYQDAVKTYGEDSDISGSFEEYYKSELVVLERLKNSYMEMSDVIEDAFVTKKEEFELETENVKLKNQLLSELAEEEEDYEKRIRDIDSLNDQLKEQGDMVRSSVEAYRQMTEQYGVNSAESKKFENQLLKECIAYEKLKNKIEDLQKVEEYDRKEREDIIFALNDYLKNNKEFLLSTGMSEEEIYEVAKEATGYNRLVEYSLNKPAEQEVESVVSVVGEIIAEILKETFGEIPENFLNDPSVQSFEDIFTEFGGLVQSVGWAVDIFSNIPEFRELFSLSGGNSYSSVYNLNASSSATVADQLHEIKKFDSQKKARGLV